MNVRLILLEVRLNPYRAGSSAEYVYEIGITDFFNARHAVGDGEAHAHSWKVEVCVRRPRYLGEQALIGFAEIRDRLRSLLARFENRFLNEVPPFTFQEPTVENLVAYLFEQLEQEFQGTEAALSALTIWDSPTNYVTFRLVQ